MLNLIQFNSGQPNSIPFNSVENNSFAGGFPGLLSASSERAADSDAARANDHAPFREPVSQQSSADRLPADHPSSDHSIENRLTKNHSSGTRSSEAGASGDRLSGQDPDQAPIPETRPYEAEPYADHLLAKSASVRSTAADHEQKKKSDSKKQAPGSSMLAASPFPLPEAALQPVSVPTSAPSTDPISPLSPNLANGLPQGVSPAWFPDKLMSANGIDRAAAGPLPRQNKAGASFPLFSNLTTNAAPWISGGANAPLATTGTSLTISSEAPSRQKKSGDANATQSPQAAPQAASKTPETLLSNSVSPNSTALPAANVLAAFPAPNTSDVSSLPPGFETPGGSDVDDVACLPAAATQFAAGAAPESSSAVTDAVGQIASSPSSSTAESSGTVPQTPGGPANAPASGPQNALRVPVIPSAKPGQRTSPSIHASKDPVPKIATIAQSTPANGAPLGADANRSPNSSHVTRHEASRIATQNAAESAAAKPEVNNTDSATKDLNNKDNSSTDLSGNDPGKRLTQDSINQGSMNQDSNNKDVSNKDLSNKHLDSKDLLSKDLLSKDLHSQTANGAPAPNGPLPGATPAAAGINSANPATSLSVSSFSASPAIAPQPAANSSAEASATNSPSAPPHQDAPIQQSAASGNVQLARIADRAGQSEMHIGMRISAFGSVEVHTSVHQSEVGITVGSEHGDLKTFLNAEIPALRDSLNQQNLQFSHLHFLCAGDSAGSSYGGDAHGNPQGFIYKPNFTRPGFHSEEAATTDSGGHDGEIFSARQTGLSIHA